MQVGLKGGGEGEDETPEGRERIQRIPLSSSHSPPTLLHYHTHTHLSDLVGAELDVHPQAGGVQLSQLTTLAHQLLKVPEGEKWFATVGADTSTPPTPAVHCQRATHLRACLRSSWACLYSTTRVGSLAGRTLRYTRTAHSCDTECGAKV